MKSPFDKINRFSESLEKINRFQSSFEKANSLYDSFNIAQKFNNSLSNTLSFAEGKQFIHSTNHLPLFELPQGLKEINHTISRLNSNGAIGALKQLSAPDSWIGAILEVNRRTEANFKPIQRMLDVSLPNAMVMSQFANLQSRWKKVFDNIVNEVSDSDDIEEDVNSIVGINEQVLSLSNSLAANTIAIEELKKNADLILETLKGNNRRNKINAFRDWSSWVVGWISFLLALYALNTANNTEEKNEQKIKVDSISKMAKPN